MTSSHQSYHDEFVPDAEEFRRQRSSWRASSALDSDLRAQAVRYQQMADQHHYTYQFEWLGVPIIRLPDDVLVLQEMICSERPDCVVETGVARGGSVVLSASLQSMCGIEPRVMGIDIDVFPHTQNAVAGSPFRDSITLIVGDSTSLEVADKVEDFLADSAKALLVLDSDHTHDHVLRELRLLGPLLPSGSLVLVADTVIEEMPRGYFRERQWDVGNNPLTAVNEFLETSETYSWEDAWGRRALVSEFRDGIIRKLS